MDAVMMLRVQRERMSGGYFPTEREYAIGYGLSPARLGLLGEHVPVLHPGPMNRGLEISSAAADGAALGGARPGAGRGRGAHGGALPIARRRGRGGDGMSALLRGRRSARRQGAPTCSIDGGVIAEVGAKLSGDREIDARRTGAAARPRRPAHAPARARAARTPRRSSPAPRAAALGGFTAVHAMANTDPVADTAEIVEQVHRLGARPGLVDVRPVGAVSKGLAGETLAEIGNMARSRAAVRIFSDDGQCVHDARLMRRALEYVKPFDAVVAQHAQDPRLADARRVRARGRGVRPARPAPAGRPSPRSRSSRAT